MCTTGGSDQAVFTRFTPEMRVQLRQRTRCERVVVTQPCRDNPLGRTRVTTPWR
jgi:hypothetical protein